jgi:hypothetical protein
MNLIKKRQKKYLKDDWSKAYVILTFCRIIYTLKTKEIKSKRTAAKWCLNHLLKKYHPIISSALKALTAAADWKCLCHPQHVINEESRSEIYNLGKYVSTQLNKN